MERQVTALIGRCADVNKFAVLAESADPVASLDRATRGRRPASARYREIMGPLGLGDELRVALVTKNGRWGVLCLHWEDASHGFGAAGLRSRAQRLSEDGVPVRNVLAAADPDT